MNIFAPMDKLIDNDLLKVNEIFFSIQGESSHAGRPCVFVRLTYCNLRCNYCDTEYAFYHGQDFTIDAILEAVAAFGCKLVEITGGEPLLQKRSRDLMTALCDRGYEVMLETGGSIDVSDVDTRVLKIVDFKCPSSEMESKNYLGNVDHLLPHDEVKFVIADRADFDWALNLVREYGVSKRVCQILFSPVFDSVEPVDIVNWILSEKIQVEIPNLRFQIQMHKMIWKPETRGV